MERAWPASTGEALHTSTFLGHPVGCAMALAQIAEIDRLQLVRQSAVRGRELRHLLDAVGSANPRLRLAVRGRGLMVGIEMSTLDGRPATREVWEVVRGMLQRGFLVLPEGEQGEVLALTPPLIVRRSQLSAAVEALRKVLGEL
jgi:4-aminobutyrate aminotransferase/(S)-3-amino-2-methylpropionate transaminase